MSNPTESVTVCFDLHDPHQVLALSAVVKTLRDCGFTDAIPTQPQPEPQKGGERSELDKLAHGFAYEHAETAINCASINHEDGSYETHPSELEDLKDHFRYLEMRGLIERHGEHPERFWIRDESEATA